MYICGSVGVSTDGTSSTESHALISEVEGRSNTLSSVKSIRVFEINICSRIRNTYPEFTKSTIKQVLRT